MQRMLDPNLRCLSSCEVDLALVVLPVSQGDALHDDGYIDLGSAVTLCLVCSSNVLLEQYNGNVTSLRHSVARILLFASVTTCCAA
jgi:hypothetical protein